MHNILILAILLFTILGMPIGYCLGAATLLFRPGLFDRNRLYMGVRPE